MNKHTRFVHNLFITFYRYNGKKLLQNFELIKIFSIFVH
nr:MAG TPA: hypothetical protein [Caudoviricetes sp.]